MSSYVVLYFLKIIENEMAKQSVQFNETTSRLFYSGTMQRNFDLCIPRKELHDRLSPNFDIHVSLSDLYIPRIGPPIFLPQIAE